MLVQQLAEVVDRRRGVRLVVQNRQLDLAAGDAAGLVDLVDGELDAVGLGSPERRAGSALGDDRADDVRLAGGGDRMPGGGRDDQREAERDGGETK